MRFARLYALVGIMLTVLAGCASQPIGPAGENKNTQNENEKYITPRAEARWGELIKGNLDAAYGFLSAGSKARISLDTYKSGIKPGRWRSAKVSQVECAVDDVCKVTVLVTYVYLQKGERTAMETERPIYETWRRNDNEWWFVAE